MITASSSLFINDNTSTLEKIMRGANYFWKVHGKSPTSVTFHEYNADETYLNGVGEPIVYNMSLIVTDKVLPNHFLFVREEPVTDSQDILVRLTITSDKSRTNKLAYFLVEGAFVHALDMWDDRILDILERGVCILDKTDTAGHVTTRQEMWTLEE